MSITLTTARAVVSHFARFLGQICRDIWASKAPKIARQVLGWIFIPLVAGYVFAWLHCVPFLHPCLAWCAGVAGIFGGAIVITVFAGLGVLIWLALEASWLWTRNYCGKTWRRTTLV